MQSSLGNFDNGLVHSSEEFILNKLRKKLILCDLSESIVTSFVHIRIVIFIFFNPFS